MEQKKDDNLLSEGKKPEEMSSDELANVITAGTKVIELNADGTRKNDEKPLQKGKDEKGEEQKAKETIKEPKKEIKKEETKKEEKKEELIAGKFKTVDDLVKAYHEAEKKISLQGDETSKTRKELDALKVQLSQYYNIDVDGNIVGTKQIPQQQDQLAGIREYFPEYNDNQIISLMGLNGLMINAALNKFKAEYDKNLEPVFEIRFEREVEKQKKTLRDKYQDFAELENEVNDRLSKLPSSLRAKDGSVETIFLTVRGEKLPEFIEKVRQGALQEKTERETKSAEAFVEGAGNTHVPTPQMNIETMSSDQLAELIRKQQR